MPDAQPRRTSVDDAASYCAECGAINSEAERLRAAIEGMWPAVENLRGYRVNEQRAFRAHVDSILNQMRAALND